MNKNRFLKVLMLSLVLAVAVGFMTTNVMAQAISTQIQLCSPLAYPIGQETDDPDAYLIDNFENWRSPRDNGWSVQEPCYPVWGYGIGYGQVIHVLDFEEGSQVMDVYRPMSVFLFNTPYTMYTVSKSLIYDKDLSSNDPDDIDPLTADYSMMSVKIRNPIGIESFDLFQIAVIVNCTTADNVTILFAPYEGGARGASINGAASVEAKDDDIEDDDVIQVALGRQFADGTWHLVMEDLAEIIAAYDPNAVLESINSFAMLGNQYRIDDLMFVKPAKSIRNNAIPHLFRIGPVYGTLFDPYAMYNQTGARWIFAEDTDLGIKATYNEDGEFVIAGICYTSVNKDDANDGDVEYRVTLGDANSSTFQGVSESDIFICKTDEDGEVIVDGNSPVFIDADSTSLAFTFTMGDTLGPMDVSVQRIGLGEPGDGFTQAQVDSFPPYLLTEQPDGVMIYNMPDPDPNNAGHYLASVDNPMYVVALAWQNSGYEFMPNVVKYMPALGLVFENRIVTCRVSDGIATDKETFSVSVVNYPVTNYPPLINDVDDVAFEVGKTNTYRVMAHDVDPQDMGGLVYHATLNGLPSYQVGVTSQSIINPQTGLISYRPLGEGAATCIVTVTDPRGMWAVAEFTIFCANSGTWFNHPPIEVGDAESPQTIRAGQMYLAQEIEFLDPDGDQLYYSCNIGAIGNNGAWTFQTMFPGQYLVQITAYDSWGAACTTEFILQVLPVWAI